MALSTQLTERSGNACELCGKNSTTLVAYTVAPKTGESADEQVVLCDECFKLIDSNDYSNTNYWRFIEGSIWSEVAPVQVLSYKILSKLPKDSWAGDTIEGVYLDDSLIAWANAEDVLEAEKIIHKDAFGTILESGDTVVLTQNLNVKGTNYIAPKGTIVRKIKLVAENGEQIEGKINNDTIVILTKYVKKST